MYYLRTKPAATAIQFTVDKTKLKETNTKTNGVKNGTDNGVKKLEDNMAAMVCSIDNKDECLMCGS